MLGAFPVTLRSCEPRRSKLFTSPFVLGGRGVQGLLRHCELLGALVIRAFYVTVRSWEPWCYELVTSPLAVGSLGVKSFYVTGRSFIWRLWAVWEVLPG